MAMKEHGHCPRCKTFLFLPEDHANFCPNCGLDLNAILYTEEQHRVEVDRWKEGCEVWRNLAISLLKIDNLKEVV